jgi:hypothetical protein
MEEWHLHQQPWPSLTAAATRIGEPKNVRTECNYCEKSFDSCKKSRLSARRRKLNERLTARRALPKELRGRSSREKGQKVKSPSAQPR